MMTRCFARCVFNLLLKVGFERKNYPIFFYLILLWKPQDHLFEMEKSHLSLSLDVTIFFFLGPTNYHFCSHKSKWSQVGSIQVLLVEPVQQFKIATIIILINRVYMTNGYCLRGPQFMEQRDLI